MNRFSFRRFGLLMRNDLFLHRRLLGIVALIIICEQLFHGITAYYFVEKYGFDPLNLILFLGGFLLTAFACKQLHTADTATAYLMLPATTLDKFLARYLLTSVGFILFVTVVYTPADLLARELTRILHHHSYDRFLPFHADYPKYFLAYFIGHAFIFWCAIYFRKHTLIKIFVLVPLFFLILDLYMTFLLNDMIAQIVPLMTFSWFDGKAVQPASRFLALFIDLPFKPLPLLGLPFITLDVPLFGVLSYINLKRYEL